jgi:hypothetical protein
MQHTLTLRQWSLHTHLGEVKSPALSVQLDSQQGFKTSSITGKKWMGKLHDGNDIFKTDLHPKISSLALGSILIGQKVGNRTNYTIFTGHPDSIDLPMPLGARPHFGHNNQPS